MKEKVIAIDVGYGNTKVVWGHGKDKVGKERWGEISFPSIAPRVVVDGQKSGLKANPNKILIELDGNRYYAGPAASKGIESRMLETDYIKSDLHEIMLRAGIHLAMREMGVLFTEIDVLVLGLPVSGFLNRLEDLNAIGMRPREIPVPENLRTPNGPETVTVTVKNVMITAQPYGSLRYAAQNMPETDPLFDEDGLAMVIDPGYRTFDWFVANGFKPEMKMSGSFDGGSVNILRQVSQQIGYDTGAGSLEFDLVEEGLQKGFINLPHLKIDMKPYAKTVLEAARSEVMTFLNRNDVNKMRLNRIFLTGGAASYYHGALKQLMPNYEIARIDNSLMGNARGYWLLGCDSIGD